MDVLYTVRPGDDNDELRYSLRSLKNIPHDRVFIVGYKPSWVKGVEYIPTDQDDLKNAVTTENLLTACYDSDISDDFILMNDDFFIMKPMEKLKRYNRGTVESVESDYKSRLDSVGLYVEGMIGTREYMQKLGIYSPLSYELHIPMELNRWNFINMMERFYRDRPMTPILHKRSLYGNLYGPPGETMQDVKFYDSSEMTSQKSLWLRLKKDELYFVSTSDSTFVPGQKIYEIIRGAFPDKCKYEV